MFGPIFSSIWWKRNGAALGIVLIVAVALILLILLTPETICPFVGKACAEASPAPRHYDLQRAFTPKMTGEILKKWDEGVATQIEASPASLQTRYEHFLFGYDLILPLLYAALLASLIYFVYRLQGKSAGWILAIPFGAAVFDFFENATHAHMLQADNLKEISGGLVWAGYIFSTLKFGLLFLSLIVLWQSVLRVLFQWRRFCPALLSLFITAIFLGVMANSGPEFHANQCPGHLQMEFETHFRGENGMAGIIACWKQATNSTSQQVYQSYAWHLSCDTAFAIFGYGALFFSLILVLKPTAKTLLWLPWLAAWLDALENTLHTDILRTYSLVGDVENGIVAFSFGVSIAKWAVVLLTICAVLYLLAEWLIARLRKKDREGIALSAQGESAEPTSYIGSRNFSGWLNEVVGAKSVPPAGSEFEYISQRRVAAAQGPGSLTRLAIPPKLQRISDGAQNPGDGRPPIGLTHSGGGIRSGSFNLGIQQGLSRVGILPWVDYLASVSGGGFPASALISLLSANRGGQFHFNTHWSKFPFNPGIKIFDPYSSDFNQGDPIKPESYVGVSTAPGNNTQLVHFINQSNYLAPRLGFITRDILRGIGAVLMKASYTIVLFLLVLVFLSGFQYLNYATLTPSITGQIVLGDDQPEEDTEPKVVCCPPEIPEAPPQESVTTPQQDFDIVGLIFGSYKTTPSQAKDGASFPIPWSVYILAVASGTLLALIYWRLVGEFYWRYLRRNPSLKPKDEEKFRSAENENISKEVWLTNKKLRNFTSAAYATLAILWGITTYLFGPWHENYAGLAPFYWVWVWLIGLLLLGYALIFLAPTLKNTTWVTGGLPVSYRFDSLFILVTAGIFTGIGVLTVIWLRFMGSGTINGTDIFWIWVLPLFFLGNLLGATILRVIFVLKQVGETGNEHISFWSNSAFRSIFWTGQGLNMYTVLLLVVLNLLILPRYFTLSEDAKTGLPALLVALVSGSYAAYLSNVIGKGTGDPSSWVQKIIKLPAGIRNTVLGIAVIVFVLALIAFFGALIDSIGGDNLAMVTAIGLGALVLFYLIGWRVNFNYISQHYFFRDRIAEAFMRTEIEDEQGVVYTVRDDGSLNLSAINPDGCSAPYHLVQTAINLPGSYHLGVKDFKAQSFIFSRHFTGSEITGYVRTSHYRSETEKPGGGLTKYSRVVALSGAAISSSLGLHTFFAQAFMTTLINARLGLWMLNPALYDSEARKRPDLAGVLEKDYYERFEHNTFWPSYLWDEMRGRTHERKNMINLSDGAFAGDNIALYPLFKRRCQIIIAGDASGDPGYLYQDLFRVIQQVRVEFGIKVDIDVKAINPLAADSKDRKAGWGYRHCAIGKIYYPKDESRDLEAQEGWLIYFKPVITGDEPDALLKYWERNKEAFPHPSTADQFFDLDQFEAQRLLGELSVLHTFDDLLKHYQEQETRLKQQNATTEAEISALNERLANAKGSLWGSQSNLRKYLLKRRKELEAEVRTVKKRRAALTGKITCLEEALKTTKSPQELGSDQIGKLIASYENLDQFMEDLQQALASPKDG